MYYTHFNMLCQEGNYNKSRKIPMIIRLLPVTVEKGFSVTDKFYVGIKKAVSAGLTDTAYILWFIYFISRLLLQLP